MTSYETKLGTATLNGCRILINGVWGVQGKLVDGRSVFLALVGRDDLAAAFPAPSHMTDEVPAGRRSTTIYDKMERANSIH